MDNCEKASLQKKRYGNAISEQANSNVTVNANKSTNNYYNYIENLK